MSRLCDTFQLLARRTWETRTEGIAIGLDPSEPTITESLLFDIARQHPDQVRVRKFNQREEGSRFGADWEWWFVGNGHAWGMRVQAKKLDAAAGNYRGIDAPHGRRRRQITMFLRSAQRDRLYPLYCFYNFDSPGIRDTQPRCPMLRRGRALLGCTIADGHRVQRQQVRRRWGIEDIVPLSMPWHCLVCCPHIYDESRGTSAEPEDIRRWIGERLAGARRSTSNNRLPRTRALRNAPLYVQQLYSDEPPLVEAKPIGQLDADVRDTAGIVLVRTSQLTRRG